MLSRYMPKMLFFFSTSCMVGTTAVFQVDDAKLVRNQQGYMVSVILSRFETINPNNP